MQTFMRTIAGAIGAWKYSGHRDLNSQTGTSYTFVLADAGKTVQSNNGSAVAFTVPPNASVAFEIGAVIEVVNIGAGDVTPTAGAGVTIRNSGAVAQYKWCRLRKIATNTWIQMGIA
jgi:hypothetical protein